MTLSAPLSRGRPTARTARPERPSSAHGPTGTTLPVRTARACTLRTTFRRGDVHPAFRHSRLCALATSFGRGFVHWSPPALRKPPPDRPLQCARPHRASPGSAHGPSGITLPVRTARACTLQTSFRRGCVHPAFRHSPGSATPGSFGGKNPRGDVARHLLSHGKPPTQGAEELEKGTVPSTSVHVRGVKRNGLPLDVRADPPPRRRAPAGWHIETF